MTNLELKNTLHTNSHKEEILKTLNRVISSKLNQEMINHFDLTNGRFTTSLDIGGSTNKLVLTKGELTVSFFI